MLDLSNVWPEWRATDKVGEGSYGKVYRCVRNEYGIESVCAIKVISIPQNDDSVEDMRFEGLSEAASWAYLNDIVTDFSNEIKVMEMLKNAPNIVSVENYKIIKRTATLGWDIYIRMEFLTGFPDYASTHKMTEADVFKLAKDICTALSICSKKGIVHRDIKPDNIFIDEYGNYKLGDFGVARKLAKTMDSMSRKGTYSYMAPEVYREEHYDTRADIYSLGTVMYKLLNNNRDPFIDARQAVVTVSERSSALSRRRKGEPLPPPAFASPEAARIILKACAFNPDDRYNTVDEFKADIVRTMKNGTDFFGVNNPPEEHRKSGRIRIFEIDNVGENLRRKPEEKEKSPSVTVAPPPEKEKAEVKREETKIFSVKSDCLTFGDEKVEKPQGSCIISDPPKPVRKLIRPMDIESDLPLLRPDAEPQRERSSGSNPISSPTPTDKAPQEPSKVQGSHPVEQFNAPPKEQKAPPVVQTNQPIPREPSAIDDSAAKKPPKKNKISGGKIAAIVAVIVIVVGAVAAAAYFLPDLLQEAKDSENNVDKTVDHTVIVESPQGYNIEKYNSDDVLFEVEEYDDEDRLTGSVEYVFDEKGDAIGYNEYNKSGQLVDEIRY